MTHAVVPLEQGMARCTCGAGPGPIASIEEHVERFRRPSPIRSLVTVVRAQRAGHPYERHVWPGEPLAGSLSLCRDVQYTRQLHDGLAPMCDLCRAAGLGALALTANDMNISGAARLTLQRWPPDDDPEHERRKAEVDADWAAMRANGARGNVYRVDGIEYESIATTMRKHRVAR